VFDPITTDLSDVEFALTELPPIPIELLARTDAPPIAIAFDAFPVVAFCPIATLFDPFVNDGLPIVTDVDDPTAFDPTVTALASEYALLPILMPDPVPFAAFPIETPFEPVDVLAPTEVLYAAPVDLIPTTTAVPPLDDEPAPTITLPPTLDADAFPIMTSC
jgi:hypothetical protein